MTDDGVSGPASDSSARLGSRRRTILVVLVAAAGVVALAGGAATLHLGTAPATAPPVEMPRPPVSPDAAGSDASVDRPVVDIPSTIDATGTSDVIAPLQAAVDAAPDGSVVRFPPNAVYRISVGLTLEHRHDLELDGRGARLELDDGTAGRRRNLWLVESTGIRIGDLALVGANPRSGVFQDDRQFEHGIWVDGGSDIEITDVRIDRPWGDCLYLGDHDGASDWASRIWFHDSSCEGAGRNGVAVVAARDVTIERNHIANIGYHAVDLEPNETVPVQGAARVAIVHNTVVGPVGQYFLAANGWGPIDDLRVENNTLEGTPLRVTVQPLPDSGYVRRDVLISGNRSDTAYSIGGTAAMTFGRVVGLDVERNVAPIDDGATSLISLMDSCDVTITGNQVSGGGREIDGRAGACPIAQVEMR
ncbi:MAG TPA: right-handed parallel beta-helix repeat-containing protein [Candidatus Limnocylindrales bacterium]|nr:right-handed parallel beta-helix repeat-containing protein [Candidatus Limnocylindrales bacterium]